MFYASRRLSILRPVHLVTSQTSHPTAAPVPVYSGHPCGWKIDHRLSQSPYPENWFSLYLRLGYCLPRSCQLVVTALSGRHHHQNGRSLQTLPTGYCRTCLPVPTSRILKFTQLQPSTWKEFVQKDCQARNLNKEDAMDPGRWKKLIKIG